MTINNETRCPLHDDAEVRGGDWPLEARKVMQEAGPRQQGPEHSRTVAGPRP